MTSYSEWTKGHTQKLKEVAHKCSNLHQLAVALNFSYDKILRTPELRLKCETALMDKWGDRETNALGVLHKLMQSENEDIQIRAASKIVDVAEKQKDRIEPQKIEITEGETSAGMTALYAKFARIQGFSEDPERLDTKEG